MPYMYMGSNEWSIVDIQKKHDIEDHQGKSQQIWRGKMKFWLVPRNRIIEVLV